MKNGFRLLKKEKLKNCSFTTKYEISGLKKKRKKLKIPLKNSMPIGNITKLPKILMDILKAGFANTFLEKFILILPVGKESRLFRPLKQALPLQLVLILVLFLLQMPEKQQKP